MKQDVVLLQIGDDRRQVPCPFHRRPGGCLDINPHLSRHDVGQRCLSQPRGAIQQDMVQRLAPLLGSRYRYRKVPLHLVLPYVLGKVLGAQTQVQRSILRVRFRRYYPLSHAPSPPPQSRTPGRRMCNAHAPTSFRHLPDSLIGPKGEGDQGGEGSPVGTGEHPLPCRGAPRGHPSRDAGLGHVLVGATGWSRSPSSAPLALSEVEEPAPAKAGGRPNGTGLPAPFPSVIPAEAGIHPSGTTTHNSATHPNPTSVIHEKPGIHPLPCRGNPLWLPWGGGHLHAPPRRRAHHTPYRPLNVGDRFCWNDSIPSA